MKISINENIHEQKYYYIRHSQYEALRAVNKNLIKLYRDIGGMIVEKQNDLGWGQSIVEQLSKDIQKAYPGIKDFLVETFGI